MPRSPLAQSPAGQIVQRLGETVPGELLGQRFLRERIGKEIFDAAESGLGRGLEADEKVDLVEQHGEVGGEFRHERDSQAGLLVLRDARVAGFSG